jgi:type VI secretion system secreted protein VgrG
VEGGVTLPKIGSAKNFGPELEKAGFHAQNEAGYVPQKGDIVVIQPYVGGKPDGHIAAYDGKQWVSDFKQRDFWGGHGYRTLRPSHRFYRLAP